MFIWSNGYTHLIPPRVISKFSKFFPCNQWTVDESIATCRIMHVNSMVESTS